MSIIESTKTQATESLILNSVFIRNNSCITFDASPYIHETNNDAEFTVVTTRKPISSYTLELWVLIKKDRA